MQLSAVIIFLGAAWNAELAESRKGSRSPCREQIIRVDCYSGYKGDERPARLKLKDGARKSWRLRTAGIRREPPTFALSSATAIAICFAMKRPRTSGASPAIEQAVAGQFPVSRHRKFATPFNASAFLRTNPTVELATSSLSAITS